MPQTQVKKTLVIPGEKGREVWPSNDAYVAAEGTEMIGVCGQAQTTREPGPVGSEEEWFRSGRPVLVQVRRSDDNGLTWQFDEKPFWELTPELEDGPYGYVYKSINGHVLDPKRDALIRFTYCYYVCGPAYYGAGSPQHYQSRIFYQVSRDRGRSWTQPHQVVCEGNRNDKGDRYFWLQWAPGVVWGENAAGFDQPSTLWLPDDTLLVGFYRLKPKGSGGVSSAAMRVAWMDGPSDTLTFEINEYMDLPAEVSSEGVAEPSFVLLDSGEVLATTRSSGNEETGAFARVYAFTSRDGGRTWGEPFELKFDEGQSLNVPTSMSKTLRCSKNGRIYWLGNMLDEPAFGYAPRNKLVAIEIAQNPPRFVRDSVTVIDQSPLGEGQKRFSNFVLYEDRVTGNPIVLLGEHQATEAWDDPEFVSNGYRYEIQVE